MHTRVIIDLDSGSVGGCIIDAGDPLRLSHVLRVPFSAPHQDAHALTAALVDAVARVADELARAFPSGVSYDIVAASPWFDAHLSERTVTKSQTYTAPFRASLVAAQRAESPLHDGQVLLEEEVVETLVNGYRTDLEHPVSGAACTLRIYRSVSDASLHTAVERALRRARPSAEIRWHTTPLVYARAFSESASEARIVIDVGSEVTDLMVIDRGSIRAVRSIAAGYRTLARSIAGTKPVQDTLSRLILNARGELRAEEGAALMDACVRARRVMHEPLIAALTDIGNTTPLAHRVLLVADPEALPWLTPQIAEVQFAGRPLIPTAVSHEFLRGVVQFGDGGSFDASLVTAALFFHTHPDRLHKKTWLRSMLYSNS